MLFLKCVKSKISRRQCGVAVLVQDILTENKDETNECCILDTLSTIYVTSSDEGTRC